MLSKHYACSFVGFKLGNWSDEIDEQHRALLAHVKFDYISATRTPFFMWFISGILQKIAGLAYPFFKHHLEINAYASNKRSWLLKNKLQQLDGSHDLVIAHNMGALYPAWRYSKERKIPFCFDVEDYHPGERQCKTNADERSRVEYLLKKILPTASLITYASKPIGDNLLALVGTTYLSKQLYISNAFYSDEFVTPRKQKGKVKFIWFSQYITSNRGLELVLPILNQYRSQLEVTLIGSLRSDFFEHFLKPFDFINIHEAMNQKDLHVELADHDIGLACELSSVDLNKDLALSNKLLAYVQAGLYVMATDTAGQEQFICENHWAGVTVGQSKGEIENKIKWILENIETIRSQDGTRFEKAQNMGWTQQGERLMQEVKNILT